MIKAIEANELSTPSQAKNLRIAHILSGSQVWGVENYVHNLLQSPNAESIKPLIICTKESSISQKFRESNFEVTIFPINGYFDFGAMNRLKSLLLNEKIHLVHLHLGLDSFVGAFAAKLANIPSIMSVHFDHPNWIKYSFLKRSIWRQLQMLKNNYIAHFLPITENVGRELSLREAVPMDKITVVHPGIPLFEVAETTDSEMRLSLGASDEDVVIIGIGRLEIEKNFSCVVESIAALDQSLPVKVWIVGDGSQRTALEQLVIEKNLSHKVRLLGYRSDIVKLLACSDIFVLASIAEPFGMSAVEAMIAKLPVVATQGPGLGTIVSDKETGLLVPPGDATGLSQALTLLVKDSSLRSRFAAAGRARAENLFSSDFMASKVVQIYRKVTENFVSK
ncbi:MAG TPA: glycosyltransferase family 4 protein [Drouetiella sp.]